MYVYRVDSRTYNVGDTILPAAQFEHELDAERAELEELLNELRPRNIPMRSECLFLFMDIAGALRYISKYGGCIYKVKPNLIYFRGDMNKLDNALDVFRFTEDPELRTAVVNEYWKPGTHTYNPCYEILVNSAIVESMITIDEQQLKDQIKELGYCIEKCPTYIALINETYR